MTALTDLTQAAVSGDRPNVDELLPLVFEDWRHLAAVMMA
jgi:hypothetical protein